MISCNNKILGYPLNHQYFKSEIKIMRRNTFMVKRIKYVILQGKK